MRNKNNKSQHSNKNNRGKAPSSESKKPEHKFFQKKRTGPSDLKPGPRGNHENKNLPPLQPQPQKNRQTGQNLAEGRVDIHPDGFGFLIPTTPGLPNIYIPEEDLKHVMHRDHIRVRIEQDRGTERLRGRLVQILKRQQKEFIGTLRLHGGGALVVPEEARDRKFSFKVVAMDEKIAGLKSGDTVLARIESFPDMGAGSVEVVGKISDPKAPHNDTLKILLSASWPRDFTPSAVTEAERRAQDWKTLLPPSTTKDVRKLNLVTIDGADAKDFDDAVCAQIEGNQIRVWVAIADVSLFVRPGSKLDAEAYERATSLYFPDHVVPMLPEVLSNGVCSLNPFEERPCLVCEFILDSRGTIKNFQFYEGLMQSQRRLTYEQMQAYMEDEPWAREELSKLKPSMDAVVESYKRLRAARTARGSVDLDLPEAKVRLNADGSVLDIQSRARLDSHRLIEELMLAANQCAAKFLNEQSDLGAVYRIHEKPDLKKIEDLLGFLKLAGLSLEKVFGKSQHGPKGGSQKRNPKDNTSALATLLEDPQDFAKLLDFIRSDLESQSPTARALQYLVLRSLKQARYSPERLGHFALSTDDYTHFTSPIRRYPDLMVHRLIKAALKVDAASATPTLYGDRLTLETACRHCSEQERSAMDAERKLIDLKKCRFMEPRLGEDFDAWISGLTEKGAFCQIEGHFVDGLITADTLLSRARLKWNPDRMVFVGVSGKQLKLGDRLKIRLVAVDLETRKIEFDIPPGGLQTK